MYKTCIQSLPDGMTRINSCCFTGHRTIPEDQLAAVTEKLHHAVRLLSSCGFLYFICGGALGFDMLAEQVLIEEAERNENIHLVLALPCRDQTGKWLKTGRNGTEILREYMRIKASASAVCYVTDFYTDGCMKERNRFMVDNSSFCVAYYNGSVRSGAGQTFRMAKKSGLKIYNIYDALASAGPTTQVNTINK